MRKIRKYLRDGSVTTVVENDTEATQAAIRKKAADGYAEWLGDLFSGIEEKRGIRNNVDFFTPSGNRRSFESLHCEITLENIVRAMKADTQKGNAVFGANGIFGLATTAYKSIDDIKKDVGRLGTIDATEYEADKEAFRNRFAEIGRSIANKKASNSFMALDSAFEAICDAVRREKTQAGIARVLKEYDDFLNIGSTTAEDVYSLVSEISKMPTEYFEAKPERAVELDEIKAVVMPADKYSDLKTRLQQRGIAVQEYNPDIDGDRLRALNSEPVKSLRFSIKDVEPVDTNAIIAENEKLKAANELLSKQFQLTKGHRVSDKALDKLAGKILAQTKSAYSRVDLVAGLKTIFDYLSSSDTPVWDEVQSYGAGLAKKVLAKSRSFDADAYNEYSDFRNYLRNSRFRLTSTQASDIRYVDGSLRPFMQSVFGRIALSETKGIYLDVVWNEICEMSGWQIDPDINEGDMPYVLRNFMDSIKKERFYTNEYGYGMDEAAYDLFLQMYDAYFDIPEAKTFADRKAKELALTKAKYRDMMADMRADSKERYNARLKELRAENVLKRQLLSRQYNETIEQEKLLSRMVEGRARMEERNKRIKELAAQKAILKERYKKLSGSKNEQLLMQRAQFQEWKTSTVAKQKERDAVLKYRKRIENKAKDLHTWLMHPTDAKHVPEALRGIVARFLGTVDFAGTSNSQKAQKWREYMRDVQSAVSDIVNESGKYADFYAEIDPDLINRLETFVDTTAEVRTVAELDAEHLHELDYIIGILRKSVMEANRLLSNSRYKQVAQLADASIWEMNMRKEKKPLGTAASLIDNLLNIEQMDSFSYFDELGDAAKSILNALRNGFDVKVRDVESAMNFLKEALVGFNKRQFSEIRSFDVTGGKLKLSVGQVMELYLHSKREQSLGHILGGGIKPADITVAMPGKKGRKIMLRTNAPVHVSENDLANILSALSPAQKKLADAMQEFVGTVESAWGNDTSVKVYGYKKFTERHYWTIQTDENYTKTSDPNSGSAFSAVKNMGMTKAVVKGANNPLIVRDIFDTFVKHTDDMSTYHGLMAPLSDALKWYNFRSRAEDGQYLGSTKQSIVRVLGEKGKQYFVNFIKDINGLSQGSYSTDLASALIRNAKIAAVGANLRVVLQQPTAYIRAAALLNPKYLAAAAFKKTNIAKAKEYAAIALWKSWGFYDLNIGKSMRNIIVGDASLAEKIGEASLWLAGKADDITWGALWNACEMEIQDSNSDLKPGSEEYDVAVGNRLTEIIDRTQVVDSVFHRSQMARSKDLGTKMASAFMSEPNKSYNMLRNALVAAARDKTGKSTANAFRVALTFVATSISTAAAAAIADAFRDDDDKDEDGNERKWIDKYFDALGVNVVDAVNPLNLVPYIKDIWSMVQGYTPTRMDLAGIYSLVNSALSWQKYFAGDSKKSVYKLMSDSVKAISKTFGVPAGSLLRTFESAYNAISETGIDWESKTSTQKRTYEAMYEALMDGDTEAYNRYAAGLEKGADDIDAGVAGALANDTVIAEAYKYRKIADTTNLMKIYKELQAKGFTYNAITRAINRYENSLDKQEDSEKPYKQMAAYSYNDLFTAIRNAAVNGSYSDIDVIYDELLATSGSQDPRKAIKAQVATEFKAEYIAYVDNGDTYNADGIRRVLVDRFGYSDDDLHDWVMSDKVERMQAAIATGDTVTANELILEQQSLGREQRSITQAITSKYKPLVIEVYLNDDTATMQRIMATLASLSLYDDGSAYYTWERMFGWIEDYLTNPR